MNFDQMDPETYICDFSGHDYVDAGGGLEICITCQTERWAERDDEFTGAGCCPEEDDYLRAKHAKR